MAQVPMGMSMSTKTFIIHHTHKLILFFDYTFSVSVYFEIREDCYIFVVFYSLKKSFNQKINCEIQYYAEATSLMVLGHV